MRLPFAVAMICAAALPAAALAQPQLVASSPAGGSTASRPARLTLTFSEPLVAARSGFDLTMTAMPGMANHGAMPVRGFATQVAGKTIVASLPRPLPAGTYELKWRAAGADNRPAEGRYTFTVR